MSNSSVCVCVCVCQGRRRFDSQSVSRSPVAGALAGQVGANHRQARTRGRVDGVDGCLDWTDGLVEHVASVMDHGRWTMVQVQVLVTTVVVVVVVVARKTGGIGLR
jgi:hypothetical protein